MQCTCTSALSFVGQHCPVSKVQPVVGVASGLGDFPTGSMGYCSCSWCVVPVSHELGCGYECVLHVHANVEGVTESSAVQYSGRLKTAPTDWLMQWCSHELIILRATTPYWPRP